MTIKTETFETELKFIKNETLKKLAEMLLEETPDYMYKVPASSTGKYHPSYGNGEGGLVKHIKASVRIAQELLNLEMYSAIAQYHDYIIIALLLHDALKYGQVNEKGEHSEYSCNNHAKLSTEWLLSLIQKFEFKPYENDIKYIAFLVLTHMGQWNTDFYTGVTFAPKPQTQEQMFVHLCDYLASRKCLEFNFDAEIK